jgi:hypothetical protein
VSEFDGKTRLEDAAETAANEVQAVAGKVRRAVRRRRRENVEGGRRGGVVKVTVTEQERAELVVKAGLAGVSVPRLLVEGALRGDPALGETYREIAQTLLRMQRVIGGVALNVNQLAAKANSDDAFPDDARALKVELRRVFDEVSETLEAVRERLG